ncbi:hypothetical protein IAR50_007283 [Cryptococcus sp. DSM 104548]
MGKHEKTPKHMAGLSASAQHDAQAAFQSQWASSYKDQTREYSIPVTHAPRPVISPPPAPSPSLYPFANQTVSTPIPILSPDAAPVDRNDFGYKSAQQNNMSYDDFEEDYGIEQEDDFDASIDSISSPLRRSPRHQQSTQFSSDASESFSFPSSARRQGQGTDPGRTQQLNPDDAFEYRPDLKAHPMFKLLNKEKQDQPGPHATMRRGYEFFMLLQYSIQLMQQEALGKNFKESASRYIDTIFASSQLPTYRDSGLALTILDIMDFIKTGSTPEATSTAYAPLVTHIKTVLRAKRAKITLQIQESVARGLNLWLLGEALIGHNERRTSSFLGRVALLRKKWVYWNENLDLWKQQDVADKERNKKQSPPRAVPFFAFFDKELRAMYLRGDSKEIYDQGKEAYYADIRKYGILIDDHGSRRVPDGMASMSGLQKDVDDAFRTRFRKEICDQWPQPTASRPTPAGATRESVPRPASPAPSSPPPPSRATPSRAPSSSARLRSSSPASDPPPPPSPSIPSPPPFRMVRQDPSTSEAPAPSSAPSRGSVRKRKASAMQLVESPAADGVVVEERRPRTRQRKA